MWPLPCVVISWVGGNMPRGGQTGGGCHLMSLEVYSYYQDLVCLGEITSSEPLFSNAGDWLSSLGGASLTPFQNNEMWRFSLNSRRHQTDILRHSLSSLSLEFFLFLFTQFHSSETESGAVEPRLRFRPITVRFWERHVQQNGWNHNACTFRRVGLTNTMTVVEWQIPEWQHQMFV